MRIWTVLLQLVFLSTMPLSLNAQAGPGENGLTLSPIRLVLSAKAPTALLSLRNGKSESVRFQLRVFSWTSGPKGEMVMALTDDIVFFPPLLTIKPSEERKIRIGSPVPFGSAEKSYRLIVEELPPLEKPSENGDPPGIQVLLKYSLPIFMQPGRVVSQAQIEGLAVENRHLTFRVKNEGNVHLLLQKVSIKGAGKSGQAVFERELQGWYVLVGDAKAYEVELAKEECGKISELTAEAKNEGQPTTWRGHLVISSSSCRAQP
jgi:fimbrial chaperone protein